MQIDQAKIKAMTMYEMHAFKQECKAAGFNLFRIGKGNDGFGGKWIAKKI